ncbi:MAG: hypothetical protein O3A29_20855 [Planctomycetota bacterium]|nr:hypothetical protein [Planctomycetota bacterium]
MRFSICLTRITVFSIVIAGAIGCSEEMTGIGEKPKNAPNVIAPGGIDDLAGRPAGANDQPAPPPAAPANDGKGIIGKTTNEVVNAKVALQHPNIVVVENKSQGGDPISFAASAYVSARSQASTFGMLQAIKTHQALNDKYPTYEEFMKIMQENRVEFTMLYPYQRYGYDEETGSILILQDNDDKAQRYKAAGIPLDEPAPAQNDPNAGTPPPAGNPAAPGVQIPGLPGRSLPQ